MFEKSVPASVAELELDHKGRVRVYEPARQQMVAMYPVDAIEAIRLGSATLLPPADSATAKSEAKPVEGYASMKVPSLRDEAKRRHINGWKHMGRDELIVALEEFDRAAATESEGPTNGG